jgi:LEA14-like dessication related protein
MGLRAVPLGVLALAALAGGGCAGVADNFKEPEFRLDRVVVRGVGFTGGTLDLVVNVYNPNNFNLRGTKLRVGFDVQDSHVGEIEYNEDFNVDQGDTTAVTLPLTFQWAGVSGAVRTALGYGDIPYKLKGEATLATPWGQRKVPFTREGRAPLTRSGGGVALPTSRPS